MVAVNMAKKIALITVGQLQFVHLDADPSLYGYQAPIGSLAVFEGKIFIKHGPLNTDYSKASDQRDLDALVLSGNSNLQDAKDYTDSEIQKLINFAPEALNTLKELSDALNADPDFANNIIKMVNDEKSRAMGEESRIEGLVDAEKTRAMAEESRLAGLVGSEELRAVGEESRIEGKVDLEKTRAMGEESRIEGKVDEEKLRAMGEESRIEGLVGAEKTRAMSEESRIEGLVDAEKTRAMGEESRIEGKVDEEKVRAMGEESRIEGKVDEEKLRAMGEEARIEGKVDEEKLRAMGVESQLQTDLSAEVLRATSAEGFLTSQVNDVYNQIISEGTRAQNAEMALLGEINLEASRAQNVESQLKNEIDAEVSRAQSIENVLSDSIVAETNRASGVETYILGQLENETNRAKAEEARIEGKVDSEKSRAMAEEASLSLRLDGLEADPTTKSYVDAQDAAKLAEAKAYTDSVKADLLNGAGAAYDTFKELQDAIIADEGIVSGLATSIANETTRATAAEQKLTNDLAYEVSQAVIRENVIAQNLDSLISAEETRAMAAEAQIASDLLDLDGYAQDIRNDLDGEILRATSAESALSSRVTTLENAPSVVQDQIVDGVADKAPSQNAVYDALALKANLSYVEEDGGYFPLTASTTPYSASVGARKIVVSAGTGAQTIVMPSVVNLRVGMTFEIINRTGQLLTVNNGALTPAFISTLQHQGRLTLIVTSISDETGWMPLVSYLRYNNASNTPGLQMASRHIEGLSTVMALADNTPSYATPKAYVDFLYGKSWKINSLEALTAISTLGSASGNYDIKFVREGQDFIILHKDGSNIEYVQIMKNLALAGLNPKVSSANVEWEDSQMMYFIAPAFKMKQSLLRKEYEVGGGKVIERSVGGVTSNAPGASTFGIASEGLDRTRIATLKIIVSSQSGTLQNAVFKKSIHVDSSNNVVLIQDDFTSRNTAGSLIDCAVSLGSGGAYYLMAITGLDGIVEYNIVAHLDEFSEY